MKTVDAGLYRYRRDFHSSRKWFKYSLIIRACNFNKDIYFYLNYISIHNAPLHPLAASTEPESLEDVGEDDAGDGGGTLNWGCR